MKTLVLVLILVIIPLILSADVVKDKAFEQIQPDGTKITLYVTGDEFYRNVFDRDGYTVLLHPETGYAVYAVPDGNTIKASDYIVGKVNPGSLGIAPRLEEDPLLVKQKVDELRSRHDTIPNRNVTIGQFNNLVVFIRFADQTSFPTVHNRTYFNTFYNSTGAQDVSLKKFFLEDSNNQLTVDTYMYPNSTNSNVVSYVDSHNLGYYQYYHDYNPEGYGSTTIGYERLAVLLRNAIVYLSQNNQVPTSIDFDQDNNGWLDNVNFVIRGESFAWGHPLWPHSWTFDELGAAYTVLNSLQIQNYTLTMEEDGTLATSCHEFSHTIGFPDLYRYYNYTSVDPAAGWDLMSFHPDIPIHHLVYMKYKYGHWCPNLITSTNEGYYYLNPVINNTFGNFKFASTDPDEFYMVEYRLQDGLFESNLQGTGLIIYRINTSVGNGNALGPPDEVYVYRRMGTPTSNGDITDSFYSAQCGRTAIHAYTEPEPFLTNSTINGGLILTEIGSASSSISFRKRNNYPKIWTGAYGNEWSYAGNWLNGLPDQNYDVEIPSDYNPPVITSTAHCKSLHIDAGGELTIQGSVDLIVHENFSSFGNLILSGAAGLNVYGDTAWNYGATIAIDDPNACIDARGDMDFNPGSDINMYTGRIQFGDPDTAFITVKTSTVLCNIISYKTSPNYLGISAASTSTLIVKGGIYVYPGKSFKNYHPGNIFMEGNLVVNDGYFNCYAGIMSFQGDNSLSITNSSALGNDFYNLKVITNGTARVNLNTPIKIKGYLNIGSCVLNSNSNNIEIKGDWNNMYGPQNFIEGTSTVTFSGTLHQVCRSEEFYNLVLNKVSGEMQILSTYNVYCINFDWVAGSYKVDGGSFMVRELADPGIFGTIILNSGTIGYFLSPESVVDLRGNLTIHGGEFIIDNGVSPCRFSNGDTASLTMDGGMLLFNSVGILIPAGGTFNDNISGGTIKTPLGFEIARSGFNPTGGTIILSSSLDCSLAGFSGSNFYNVMIDKGRSESEQITRRSLTRASTVTGTGVLDINGDFNINSGTFLAPPTMTVSGYWTCHGSFTHNNGTVTFDGSSDATGVLSSASFHDLVLNNSSANWNNFKIAESDTLYAANNLSVSNGTIILLNNSMLRVAYNLVISSGAGINCTQGTGNVVTVYRNWTDNNTTVTDAAGFKPGLSTLNLSGLYAASVNVGTPYFEVYNLVLNKLTTTMSITFNKSVHVLGNFSLNRGTWTDISAGFTHEFYGNFTIGVNGRWNTANRNTISICGLITQTFTNSGGSYFYNLAINQLPLLGMPICYLGSNITLSNAGFLQVNSGILDLNGNYLNTTGSVTINNMGKLSIDADATLKIANGKTLTVNNGGTLEAIGTSGLEAWIMANGTGNYALNVESGGNISAAYAYFLNMDAAGVNVKFGALVNNTHCFHNCIFQYGAAGGTLLTINNEQEMTIYNVNFPANTWSGTFNVTKPDDHGTTVTFVNATGAFSGAAFESDSYSNITWVNLPPVQNLTISFNHSNQRVELTWTYPAEPVIDRFKVYCSLNPDGPFDTLIGTPTGTFFSPSTTGPKYFYQVRAEKIWP